MPARIIVHLERPAAVAVERAASEPSEGRPLPEAPLLAAAERYGIRLTALHGETDDPALGSYLVGALESGRVEQALADIRDCPGVDGAYLEAIPEPPAP